MNIALIGSGISGLTCALKLANDHQVTLFEANDYLGGHTATVDITLDGQQYAIDTGFIVYNQRTYPNFISLLAELGLTGQPTEMSFSVSNPQSGLEYNGHTLNTLFAQRRNLLRPQFYRFVREIVRFNQICKLRLPQYHNADRTLNDLLHQEGFSDFFAHHYVLPMGAAIWSSSLEDMRNFPLSLFLRFFDHHGLLELTDRPQWMVVPGGSREYVRRIVTRLEDKVAIHRATPVLQVTRDDERVSVHTAQGVQHFEQVIFACHADQALSLLAAPTPDERHVLGDLTYQANEVVLHTDTRLLPNTPRAWASWNYRLPANEISPGARSSVTYNMNILQGITSTHTFCVSLNPQQAIDPAKVLRRFVYDHPVFNKRSIVSQQLRTMINGQQRSWFCGAYWYNGFHEDGLNSALDVVKEINRRARI